MGRNLPNTTSMNNEIKSTGKKVRDLGIILQVPASVLLDYIKKGNGCKANNLITISQLRSPKSLSEKDPASARKSD